MRYHKTQPLSKPTYSFQAKRVRRIWQAPLPWNGRLGSYTAIEKNIDDSFSVLVHNGEQARWFPIENSISEVEVIEWLSKCRES